MVEIIHRWLVEHPIWQNIIINAIVLTPQLQTPFLENPLSTLPPYLGASFHKADLQVHSLRDRNWKGPFHPMSGREGFAKALVASCRRKGQVGRAAYRQAQLRIGDDLSLRLKLRQLFNRVNGGRPVLC
jgi:hypothetical protein